MISVRLILSIINNTRVYCSWNNNFLTSFRLKTLASSRYFLVVSHRKYAMDIFEKTFIKCQDSWYSHGSEHQTSTQSGEPLLDSGRYIIHFFFYLGGIFIKLMNSIIFFHCFSKIQSFQICFHMYSPNLVVAFVENKKVSLYNYKYTIFGELREEVNEKIEI